MLSVVKCVSLFLYHIPSEASKLRNGRQRLNTLIEEVPDHEHLAHQRIQTLMTWQKKAERGLPLLNKLFSTGKN